MKVLKVKERTVQAAMQRVHREFGSEAMIIATDETIDGVELSFAIDDDIFLAPEPESQSYISSLQAHKSSKLPTPSDVEPFNHSNNKQGMKAYLNELSDVAQENFSHENPFQADDKRQFIDMFKQLSNKFKLKNNNAVTDLNEGEDDLSKTTFEDFLGSRTSAENYAESYDEPSKEVGASHIVNSKKRRDPAEQALSQSSNQSSLQTGFQDNQHYSDLGDNYGVDKKVLELSQSVHALIQQNTRLEKQLLKQQMEFSDRPNALALKKKCEPLQRVFIQLVDIGFDDSFAWYCLSVLEEKNQTDHFDFDANWRLAMQLCIQKLKTFPMQFELGQTHCFIGREGAGKTALLAKYAHQLARQGQSHRLVLVHYQQSKIGAFEELLYLGEAYNIPVYDIDTPEALQSLYKQFRNTHTILIDTGLSDLSETSDLTALKERIPTLQIHAVVPSDLNAYILSSLFESYRYQVDSICISRFDLVNHATPLLQLCMDTKLPISCISNGKYDSHQLIEGDAKLFICENLKRFKQRAGRQKASQSKDQRMDVNSISNVGRDSKIVSPEQIHSLIKTNPAASYMATP